MSQSHSDTDRTTDDVFKALQEQCFLWEERTSVIADLSLFGYQDLLHAQESMKHTEGM